jgi:transcription elongation factor GreA
MTNCIGDSGADAPCDSAPQTSGTRRLGGTRTVPPIRFFHQDGDEMIEEIRAKLQAEVKALNHELHVVLPQTLRKAIELGDLRENSDYHAAIERQGVIQARLQHLRSRLQKLSDIDFTKIPADRVGLGSRVTVRDLDTKQDEIIELVIPDAMDIDKGHVSVSSPMGRALLDKKPKDTVTVVLPMGKRRLRIVRLETLHDSVQQEVAADTAD